MPLARYSAVTPSPSPSKRPRISQAAPGATSAADGTTNTVAIIAKANTSANNFLVFMFFLLVN